MKIMTLAFIVSFMLSTACKSTSPRGSSLATDDYPQDEGIRESTIRYETAMHADPKFRARNRALMEQIGSLTPEERKVYNKYMYADLKSVGLGDYKYNYKYEFATNYEIGDPTYAFRNSDPSKPEYVGDSSLDRMKQYKQDMESDVRGLNNSRRLKSYIALEKQYLRDRLLIYESDLRNMERNGANQSAIATIRRERNAVDAMGIRRGVLVPSTDLLNDD